MTRTHTRHASRRRLRVGLPLLAAATFVAGAHASPADGPAPIDASAAASPAETAPSLPAAAADAVPILVLDLPPLESAVSDLAAANADRWPDPAASVAPPAASVVADAQPEPVLQPDSVDPDALRVVAQRDVAALGPLSIGTPDAGLLVNPRPMPEGPLWTIRNPLETWGTQETIDFVSTAIETVARRFPGSPRVVIGDISRPDGGRLNRHKSHQAGRDIDVGFYYLAGEAPDFRVVRASSRSRRRPAGPQLDLARTWALMRAFLTETDVDRIFLDRSLIAVLYRYAREEEHEDRAWLADVFGHGERKGIVQHERKHLDHMHVRFFNRVAQERGRVVYPILVEDGVVGPPLVRHRVRRGETIGHLAAAYGTSAAAIRAANGMRGNLLRAGRSYLVPVRKVRTDAEPVVVPPRRLPPPPETAAATDHQPVGASTIAAGGGGGD
jgi:murein endopeptidase